MIKYIFFAFFLLSTHALYAQHNAVPATDGFEVTGAIKKELHIGTKDLMQMKQDTLGDLMIKNKRGEDKEMAKQMKGVLLKNIIDSAYIPVERPKELSEFYITLIASDNYKSVYSWNELFNTEVGNHVYIITEKDGKTLEQMPDRILVMSLSDINSGRRHLKGLARIEVRRVN